MESFSSRWGGAEYLSGTRVQDALLGTRAFARYAHVIAEASPVLVALHTTTARHRTSTMGYTPLPAESERRVGLGAGE